MTNETNFSEAEKLKPMLDQLKYIVDQLNSVADNSKLINEEIIRCCHKIEKVQLIHKFLNSQNIELEMHRYAPELNKIYFNKRIIKTPHVAEIDKEVGEAELLENSSYINLKEFLIKKSLCDLQILLSFN